MSQTSAPLVRVDQTCTILMVVPSAHVCDEKLDVCKCRYTIEGGVCSDFVVH